MVHIGRLIIETKDTSGGRTITKRRIRVSIIELEDCLKAIYRLQKADDFVKFEEIANEMEIPVSQAKLFLEDLLALEVIEFDVDKGVRLAEKGKVWAMSIIRKHRLTKDFLVKLGVDLSEAHPIADKLEHLISEDGEKHLEESLRRPTSRRSDVVSENGAIPLSAVSPPSRVIISRITGNNEKLIRHLISVGVIPGVVARVKKRTNPKGPTILGIGGLMGGFEVAVGKEVAANIMVKPMPGRGRHRRPSRRRHRRKMGKT